MMRDRRKNAASGLNIMIVGAGKVGYNLVEQLSREGHDITIIDQDPVRIQDITNLYDVMGYVGNGASYTTQKEAGIADADLIIAVTDSDELNLLCCTIARQFEGCASIARVRTPDYSREVGYLREKLGLALIINPELEAAREMARILYLPTALEVNSFAHGQAEIAKFKIPGGNILDGMSVAQLGSDITNSILICGVERDGEVHIPSGNFILKAGDLISVVSTRKDTKYFLNAVGFNTRQVKNAMLVGGGRSAYYLADQLIRAGISVKIIERDRSRCEKLTTLLPRAIVINGDGANPDLLKEEGIADTEAFVPLTGIDEENVVLTLHAKQVSKAKIITKINRLGFSNVFNNMDLGSVIYPKYITSEAIIAYVRARNAASGSSIETLYHLFDMRAEAIEFKVMDDSEVTGIPLRDMKLKSDLLICFIFREGQLIIPTGGDVIKPNDTVMIVTTNTGFTDIKDIIR